MLALEFLWHNSQPINLVRQTVDSSYSSDAVITNIHPSEPLSCWGTHSLQNVNKTFQFGENIRASVFTAKSYNTQKYTYILVAFSKIENPIVYEGILKKLIIKELFISYSFVARAY